MSNIPVVLVHGAWLGGWAWEPLLPHLSAAGFAPVTVDLPSSHAGGDLRDDAAAVRKVILAQPEPTVVVGHSYGGMVISEATAGLDSVRHLVYVCAFMLDVGQSLFNGIDAAPPWLHADQDAGVSRVLDAASVFYQDLAPTMANDCVTKMAPQSLSSFAQPLTGAGWRDIDSSYVVCAQDKGLPPQAQRHMSANARHVHELDSSHSPFASQPRQLAALISNATCSCGPVSRTLAEGSSRRP